MKSIVVIIVFALILTTGGLYIWRLLDHRADRNEMSRLIARQPVDPPHFNISMVADLPEPAKRFFEFAISEGTPLYTIARIDMAGKFGMGTKSDPKYMNMTATQVLAAPEGFVWKMSAGSFPMLMGAQIRKAGQGFGWQGLCRLHASRLA